MKRTIALGAAWTASAAAAVGLGFLAVSLVDASASPGTTDRAAATTTVSPATGTATPTASPAPPAAAGEHVTVGGTVFASCAGGVPSLAGAPAPGWWVDDSNDPGEVQFENGTSKVEVHTVCVGDVPQFSDEGLRADDSGRGSGSPASSSGSSSSTSGRDDSEDDSSGHGSDDPPGDDSSGRDGGGHGSDD
jgi:hypothetical protein